MNKIYKIASKIVSKSYGGGPASKLLEQEFALYESANLPPDIVIRINKESDEDKILSRNPTIHVELKKGFQCHFGNSSVTWRKEEEGEPK